MARPAARSRSSLSSVRPALAAALGLCLLAACKSVPAIDPGKPPAMDPASGNATPPASVSAAQNLGDIIVGLRAPTDSAATLQTLLNGIGARATPPYAFTPCDRCRAASGVVRAASGEPSATLDGAIAALRAAPGIASADADRILKPQR